MNTEKIKMLSKFGSRQWNKNKNQGAVHQIPKTNRRSGRRYKDLLKSKAKKANGSDLSTEKKDELSGKGCKVIEANDSNNAETTIDESSSSCSKSGSSGFHPRWISHTSHEERSCSSCHGTQTINEADVDHAFSKESKNDKLYDVDSIESLEDSKIDKESEECVICSLGGKLLFCAGRGCTRSFHLSCVNPPLSYVPLGIWHCIWCVQKKIKSGVHTVSEGIESILDAEKLISNDEEMQKQRQYFVKYKGLAHIHNRWIPERELILENPAIYSRYQKHNRKVHWKNEWLVPCRLLDKRLILFPKTIYSEFHGQDDNVLDCHHEWLVKWTGLDYHDATWELENASFFKSPEAIKLIIDYENRHQKIERLSNSSREDEDTNSTFSALEEFPFDDAAGACDHYLVHVNKLLDKWQRDQNALVIDDQEKIVKMVLFISSLQRDVTKPFLIITPATAISLWEAEFSRWTSSTNVIVYKGNTDVRAVIRALELYNEGGNIMFQVLISPPNAVTEDLEMLGNINWEAIIIDECQRSSVVVHLRTVKMLRAGMRLLLSSGQIKEMHYNIVHSFLDPKYDDISEDISRGDTYLDRHKLKDKLSHFVAYECKSTMPNFVEYWVPVRLSNVQTEQYCASLFSNSRLLCSGLKSDSVDALQEILISIMKCCDHPYLVDRSLRNSVIEGIPVAGQLNAEIELSGKLHLLHMILLEIKKQELRVLILFQSLAGSGLISIGDILDDIIHEKFGKDSYVRIGGGISLSRKRAALNVFNDKENRKFVCLMEIRACLPSIKLLSIDTVILFNSDWDPMNDLRALHKINLTSGREQLKIFRLYSSCTVEEKILILAKQGMTPEGNINNIKQSTCHRLLTWGASYLFHKLHGFHDINSHSSISSGETFIEDVFHELLTLLPNSSQSNDSTNCSLILKVQETRGIYPRNVSLIGEVESSLMGDFSMVKDMIDNEQPHVFWINLLEGRNPRWKYLSSPPSRAKKRGKRLNDLPEEPEEEEKTNKKFRKEASTTDRRSQDLKPRVKKKLHTQNKKRKLSDLQQPCHSSVQHAVTDELLQPSSNMQLDMTGDGNEPNATNLGTTNASLNSGNNDRPEANKLTYFEAQQSVCLSLQRELGRLQKDKDESIKFHEDMKLRLKLALEEEINQISRKYDFLLQIAEMEFVEKKETLETSYNNVYINKVLAETMMQNKDVTDATCSQEMPNSTTNSLMNEMSQVILQQIGPRTVTKSEHVPGNLPVTSSPGFSIVQASNQASASARIVSRPDEPSLSHCMTVPQPLTSAEVVNCTPCVQQIPVAMDQASTNQPLTSPYMTVQQYVTLPEVANYSSSFQQTSGTTPRPEMSSESLPMIGSAPVTRGLQGLTQTLTGQSTDANTILPPMHSKAIQAMNGTPMISTLSMQLPRTSPGLLTPVSPFSNPNFPFSGNLQSGYELRAPAPHLRSMNPPMPISGSLNLLSSPSTGVSFHHP
ncbi:Uncharacterized protein Fot_28331 [Forsythia ovata]|uniref:Uncharacterized protein n=1 Tax=Forsythia ovata TaxID=205694 RepID=A0ABD1TNP5_9LAMI